jgi:hypothetical protein
MWPSSSSSIPTNQWPRASTSLDNVYVFNDLHYQQKPTNRPISASVSQSKTSKEIGTQTDFNFGEFIIHVISQFGLEFLGIPFLEAAEFISEIDSSSRLNQSPTNFSFVSGDRDERQERCHRVTLALLRASMDFEVRLELSIKMANERRSMWMEALDTVCLLFSACYRPVVLNRRL